MALVRAQDLLEFDNVNGPRRDDKSEFSQKAAQRIDGGGSLANEQRSRFHQSGDCLLFGLLMATKRIPGCVAALAIASASRASHLSRLTNGLTYCAGMSNGVCPDLLISLAQ
ncbi:hypothetical protein [Rhizobium sp. BE258]|uniref:hypothetical protein n=1 Tax=Rhizobium sp. BE258 TaxID=2817722 RepID=UPI0028542D6E|nr:hypothetical protein [Rhizobium sp. BE258]MDR7144699.1 hypothetical protein [Rhizobium sp. BE258]